MRVRAFVFALLLLLPGAASAQEWEEYTSLQDGFTLNFPGQPKVTETKWTSQLNYVLPARVYLAEKDKERYSLTVVDYSSIEQQGVERAKSCPPGNANCRANAPEALGAGYARHDERGAIVYATFKLLQRDAKLNYLAWEWQDLVEGHIVQLTNNADQSRTFAWVGMHAAQAVHPRRHGAGELSGAGPVPAVDAVGRQGRKRDPVPEHLLELVSTAWACTRCPRSSAAAPAQAL